MERKKIPFSNDFYVDTDGNVYGVDGNKRNTCVNGDGYITVNIKTSENLWITFGVHRLVAITHIPRKRPDQHQVNHRDLDLTNNRATNLEWVTALENNTHSAVMRADRSCISVYAVKAGVPTAGYYNAHDAAKAHASTALDVWDSIKDGTEIAGVIFCFRKASHSLPAELTHNRRNNFKSDADRTSAAVKSMDIYSGEERHFSSIGEAARYFQTSPSHIYVSISKTAYPRVFRKRYQIAYSCNDFPQMTAAEIERAKSHGRKQVLAFNFIDRKCYVFPSAVEFIKQTKLSKKSVTVCLKKNQIRQIGDWVAVYSTVENAKLLASYLSGPAER
ncbi:MAG: HNH endonuclease signature motif containing protein [Candidatus Nanopelagicales bacterium]|nr:HNH endonuclease signature motif containing protein [Candidatus Nanopelagicales bacterium]